MAKYEIMLILAPTEDFSLATKLAKEVFKDGVKKAEKLERTHLAYPINKSTTGTYVLLNVESEESVISEFVRKANIQKTIWRTLVINLDSERGLNRKAKPKRMKRSLSSFKKNQSNSENSLTESKKEDSVATKKTVKKQKTVKKSESTEESK
ncbi:30S ribosomal protein S6 [Mesomycoplasma lagogenitalium]|uniref:Small ribosomal subunit protein bS6 n=1 Tax=Mesomycoplasma lagogenitalium TaxID=171286 RepID=A0ABY8LSZ1_9BACT|nr:30S ribosomal protein S6 [Mesomycoplasma lagogenitalium]WGI36365.1 30S ribosomal protein S6 [Mesomycoplasma lagogenitalium]